MKLDISPGISNYEIIVAIILTVVSIYVLWQIVKPDLRD
jgi:hypothetical protein